MPIRTSVITAFALLFFASSLHAQWVRTNGPTTSSHPLRRIQFIGATNQVFFAETASDSLFVSSDKGVTWANVRSPGIIGAYATNGQDIYATVPGAGIVHTSDNWQTWNQANRSLPSTDIHSITASGNDVYAGSTSGHVYHSTDNGTSWSTTTKGIPNSTVTALAISGSNLLAATQLAGVFASTDNGASWHTSSNGMTSVGASMFGVNGSDVYALTEIGVFVSTDNGTDWTASNNGFQSQPVQLFLASGANMLASAASDGIFQTTDHGASWTKLIGIWVGALSSDNSRLYAMSNGYLYSSTTGGATWSDVIVSITITQNVGAQSLLETADGLYAGTTTGDVSFTSDAGDHWTSQNIKPNVPIVALVEQSSVVFAGSQNGIFRSSDKGNSWTSGNLNNPAFHDTIRSDSSNSDIGCNALAASDRGVFASVSGSDESGGLYLTTDLGVTWNQFWPGEEAQTLFVDGTQMYGSQSLSFSPNLLYSSDDGTNWSPKSLGLPGSWVQTFATIGNSVFAGTSGDGIYYTTNSGASWLPIASGSTPSRVNILRTIGNAVFAGTSGGVYVSLDNGQSWTAQNAGIQSSNTSIFTLEASNTMLFIGTDSGVYRRPLSEMTGSSAVIEQSKSTGIAAYPNPLSQSTTIRFTSQQGPAEVSIVNLLGVEVARIYSGELDAGQHSFQWDATDALPGTYFCLVRTGGVIQRIAVIVAH